MEQLNHYRNIIEEEFNYHAQIPYSNMPELDRIVIIDKKRNHFLLMDMGWHGRKYHHDCVLQVEIKEDRIHIHQDWTDIGLASVLHRGGIPREKIVLAFLTPFERQYSDFAKD